nr:MAG TPA: hypothetical protein [Inoviridae sp.]
MNSTIQLIQICFIVIYIHFSCLTIEFIGETRKK